MSDNVVSMENRRPEFKSAGRWAPLKNVALASKAVERAMNRAANLPGLVALTAPSGFGKSMAASYCANKYDGVLVECRSFFTRKVFAEQVLREMGIKPERTVGEMMLQIAEQLNLSGRPLLLDEMDHLVDTRVLEIVRDLHDMSRATILMIGEEQFGRKLLRRSERMHNRVLEWVTAQPASREDCKLLAQFYCDVPIADDWLDHVRTTCRGVTRYICVNIDGAREMARSKGWDKIDLAKWGKHDIYGGEGSRGRA